LNALQYIAMLFQTGLGNLAAYLAAHVLLCLLPAFFIAGALTALVPKEAITRFLGRRASKWVSYPAALLAGSVLAVCSCTILPLFAGIRKRGAGLGPALTFMFFAPASNILAIMFTGLKIGMDIALARILLCMVFGVSIGLIMSWLFRKEEEAQAAKDDSAFADSAGMPAYIWLFFALLVAVLLTGTLQVGLLRTPFATFTVPAAWASTFQAWLDGVVPSNAALGIEGVSVHGILLIVLLALIGVTAFRGLNKVQERFSAWSLIALLLISMTLVIAAFQVTVDGERLRVGFTGRLVLELVLLGALWVMAVKFMEREKVLEWLWEMWRFVRQIIPLLVSGVFIAGLARALIPPLWIKAVAGRNTVLGNLVPVIFAIFMYFPTLVEVPVAQTFLALGMHRGPLLAYLLADPELSLQSVLVTGKIIGKKKTALYVILVGLFSMAAGLIYGRFAA